jgi:hypothetical protein
MKVLRCHSKQGSGRSKETRRNKVRFPSSEKNVKHFIKRFFESQPAFLFGRYGNQLRLILYTYRPDQQFSLPSHRRRWSSRKKPQALSRPWSLLGKQNFNESSPWPERKKAEAGDPCLRAENGIPERTLSLPKARTERAKPLHSARELNLCKRSRRFIPRAQPKPHAADRTAARSRCPSRLPFRKLRPAAS